MTKKTLISLVVLVPIVFGALFVSQTLGTGMQMQHEMMGQEEMDPACAVHCYLAATDDIEVASVLTVFVAAVLVLALFAQAPRVVQFDRLVPVEVSYRDPREILIIQKRE